MPKDEDNNQPPTRSAQKQVINEVITPLGGGGYIPSYPSKQGHSYPFIGVISPFITGFLGAPSRNLTYQKLMGLGKGGRSPVIHWSGGSTPTGVFMVPIQTMHYSKGNPSKLPYICIYS